VEILVKIGLHATLNAIIVIDILLRKVNKNYRGYSL
jgi:hypothetical protein